MDTVEEVPEVEDPKCNKEDRILYKVRSGDTLADIAIKYNSSISHLAAINNIQNPNLIFVDEIITVSNNLNNSEEYYTIKRGDTLAEIARKFDTTVEELVVKNDIINQNLIYAGDRLRIK